MPALPLLGMVHFPHSAASQGASAGLWEGLFMELVNLHCSFSFLSLQPSNPALADTPLVQPQRDSRAVLGQKTVPNQFSGLEPRSDGLQRALRLLGLSSRHFVCSFNVPSAFGWLPPERLRCPVSSQPPGERMLLRLRRPLLSVTQLSPGFVPASMPSPQTGSAPKGSLPISLAQATRRLAPSRDAGSGEGFGGSRLLLPPHPTESVLGRRRPWEV